MVRRALRRLIARIFDYAEGCSIEQCESKPVSFPSHITPTAYIVPPIGAVPRVMTFAQGDSVARN